VDLYFRVLSRRRLGRLNRIVLLAALRSLGILNWHNPRESGEEWLLSRLAALLADRVIVDVGANQGSWSALARRLVPTATIHAVEPNPVTFARLATQAVVSGFTAHNTALGDHIGNALLFDYASGPGGTGHATLHAGVFTTVHHSQAAPVSVPLTTLDELAQGNGLDSIALLKIDTEGSESAVLRGGARLLAAGVIDVIQFEFNEMNVVSRVFMRDFVELLPGYEFYRLLPGSALPLGEYTPWLWEIFAFQNVVCVRKGSGLTL